MIDNGQFLGNIDSRKILSLQCNTQGLIHAEVGSSQSLCKSVILNIYDGSIIDAHLIHRGTSLG